MKGMQKMSRSKLELFMKCPRCFWLDVKHKVKRPPSLPYTINSAIDYLFKQEFDLYREKGKPHPVMIEAGIDAVPYDGPEIDSWRDALRAGVQFHHQPSDILLTGGVDDVWVNPAGELIVVDYKSTGSPNVRVYDEYIRQLEIYQWLLAQNGYKVSPVGYWVYAQVDKTSGFGHGKAVLPFHLHVKQAEGKWDWIPGELIKARAVLDSPAPPDPSELCMTSRNDFGDSSDAYCYYRKQAMLVAADAIKRAKNAEAGQAIKPALDLP
jgi:CRISPR/Cas system-associated exonuclease Cas4 (RecB family)